jgi:hypothetical protein
VPGTIDDARPSEHDEVGSVFEPPIRRGFRRNYGDALSKMVVYRIAK